VACLGIDPVRAAAVDFSPACVERDFTSLVPTNSAIGSTMDADQAGVRIAVVRTHASTLALSHVGQHAALVQAERLDAAFDMLRSREVHLLASARQALLKYSIPLPGSRVLQDRYGASVAAIAGPKGHAGWLAYLSEFLAEAKALGVVQRAIERAG